MSGAGRKTAPLNLTATNCGIIGDSKTLNTEQIQSCIDRISQSKRVTMFAKANAKVRLV